jgi:NAD kinase
VRGEDVIVTADGQQMAKVKVGQRIMVKKSEFKTNLIRLKEYDFFGRVSKTFGFAGAA